MLTRVWYNLGLQQWNPKFSRLHPWSKQGPNNKQNKKSSILSSRFRHGEFLWNLTGLTAIELPIKTRGSPLFMGDKWTTLREKIWEKCKNFPLFWSLDFGPHLEVSQSLLWPKITLAYTQRIIMWYWGLAKCKSQALLIVLSFWPWRIFSSYINLHRSKFAWGEK